MEYQTLICYSTQSGTSEDLANAFSSELNNLTNDQNSSISRNLNSFSTNIDEFKNEISNYKIVIFFISSYGEGEPCDDSVKLFESLEKYVSSKNSKLDPLIPYYSIFGCGNSYYDQYQAAALCFKKMLDLDGSQQIGDFGYGNEAKNGIFDDYTAWSFDYFNVLSQFLDVKFNKIESYNPMYSVIGYNENKPERPTNPPYQELKPFIADINIDSVKKYGDDYLEFEVNLHKNKSRLKYQTGDHVGIYPQNDDENVKKVLKILKLDKNIKNGDKLKVVPVNRMESNRWLDLTFISYYDLLLNSVEINGVLTRTFIKNLITYFMKNKTVIEQLNQVISSAEVFKTNIIDKRITLIKLFENYEIQQDDYDTIPLSFIMENFGYLKPRLFSITTSDSVNFDSVGVIMKLVKEEHSGFYGVCSKFLENIITGKIENRVPIFIRKSKFKLPMTLSKPLVFIGAGTGIAPFRGFLQDICSQSHKLKQVEKIVIFFGLKELNEKYWLFAQDIEKFQKILGNEKLEFVHVQSSISKEYVQDVIKKPPFCENISNYLHEKQGNIFICGDKSGMAAGVRRSLVSILGNDNVKDGDKYLRYLQSMGRFKEDVW